MSSFAEVLRLHQSGALDSEQLLAQIDRLLTDTPASARSLLSYIHAEHSEQRLSSATHAAIARHVSAWLEDRTVVSPVLRRDDTQIAGEVDAFRSQPNPPTPMGAEAETPVGVGHVLLQRFRLIEQVGEGGMSRVYKAIDLRKLEANAVDPHVAVKLLTLRFEDHFRSSAVLHREAHKLQSLTHPNIVRVIDCDRDDQTVFMTMEYLAGESLKTRLEAINQPALTGQEGARIVTRIADALEFAHRIGIVHGDLKPGNVILTQQGEVKVIDFGIARFIAKPLTQDETSADAEEVNALTPPYASPEMLEGAKPDPRDDVYALACMAYELLTGVHPFERLPSNTARDKHLVPVRRNGLTSAQFKAISAALAFDREKRTRSAREFSDQFRGSSPMLTKRVAIYVVVALAALATGYLISSRTVTSGIAPTAVAISTHTPGSVFRDCPTCPLMVVLPQGKFVQGSDASSGTAFERPSHTVTLGYQLAMGQHEVTVGEFREYIASTAQPVSGCSVYDGDWQMRASISWDTLEGGRTAVHPVACVSWNDATAYVNWLSSKTQQQYRLATASEWEYAANAGTPTTRLAAHEVCLVGNVADEVAAQQYPGWKVHECRDGYAHSAPVGVFAANNFGLQDMLGNVFEWVQDCWHEDYVGAPTDGSAWMQGDCLQHEMRGGSWFTTPGFVRPSYRNRFEADYRAATVGFRVARIIKNEP